MQTPELVTESADAAEKMIDVVEAFDCPRQTPEYMDAYRKWRRQKKNRYAFRFTKHPKEASFSENRVVVNDSPAQSEKTVLYRVSMLIGCMLIVYLVIENLFDKLLVHVLSASGKHIELLYWGESRLYGEESLVFLMTVLIYTLKYLVPAIILMAILRLPMRVSLPLPFTHKSPVLYGVAIAMLFSTIFGIYFAAISADMSRYRLISEAVGSDDHRIILYILFSVFVLPFLSELLLHGAMFQVLRQFGDMFAIVMTSVFAMLLTHNLLDAIRVGVIALLIAYYLVRSGSFLTALLLRIIHEIYMFGLYYIATFRQVYSVQWWITVLLPAAIGVAAFALYLFRRKKGQTKTDLDANSYLSFHDRVMTFLSALPTMAFLIASIILLVASAILDA